MIGNTHERSIQPFLTGNDATESSHDPQIATGSIHVRPASAPTVRKTGASEAWSSFSSPVHQVKAGEAKPPQSTICQSKPRIAWPTPPISPQFKPIEGWSSSSSSPAHYAEVLSPPQIPHQVKTSDGRSDSSSPVHQAKPREVWTSPTTTQHPQTRDMDGPQSETDDSSESPEVETISDSDSNSS